jgi:1-acyl-sn-glycerol-3-phosphate acyltransferase/nucleoside-diphosphate-sugar epimerase
MDQSEIVVAGHQGALAEKAVALLAAAGHTIRRLRRVEEPDLPGEGSARALILFPFDLSDRNPERWEKDVQWIRSLLESARVSGIERVVLRSHVVAYGFSFKNYGLMEEDRISLLDEDSIEQRWLKAEEALQGEEQASLNYAILRFSSISDPAEGDFLTRMFVGKACMPAAGHDPRIQFIDLDDAAAAIVAAVNSEATGVFNVAGRGCVDFRRTLRASVPVRLPAPYLFQRGLRKVAAAVGLGPHPDVSADQLRYNVTVSSERARRELSFEPRKSSADALGSLLERSGRLQRDQVDSAVDEFGLDPAYLKQLDFWFRFLRNVYWRVESEGLENVPKSGSAIIAPNHRGFMPFDGVVHRSLVFEKLGRQIRFLVIPSLFKFPFLSDFLIKQGGVVASQQNAGRLVERGELVGIFPEGITGAFRMYKGAYELGQFGRDAYAKMAIEYQIPIVPAAVVGHVEIFPILGKMHIPSLVRFTGWPFIPITPTFPLVPVPLPTKWHIRYLEPIPVSPLTPEDASNRRKVKKFSAHVRDVLQTSINEMLTRRKHVFFGKIFGSQEKNGAQVAAPLK